MPIVDYRAARGALTGTNFHELWAVLQALRLLEPGTELAAVSVEGFGQAVKHSDDAAEYDGVDCTLYFGSSDLKDAKRVEIVQLKYSGSDPSSKWTTARLTATDKKKGNNSVLRRLATAFRGIASQSSARVAVRLVSNQPVAQTVVNAFGRLARSLKVPQALRTEIRSATGLSDNLLARFSESLDLSSQTGSRFQLEDALLLEISRWIDADARAILDQLLAYLRKQMLPEAAQRLILRENILLTIAGSASAESLFPCPSDFSSPARIIPRSAAKQLADLLATGVQRVCLHGGAGCGKTTVLQQLEQQLPAGSHVVLFDAYGSGRYLDAARVRHRPVDAFVQLSNDMAVATSLPYFLLRSERVDARSFLRRLQNAAESLHRINPHALLALAIDAADNSVTAAQHFGERSFVHDILSIGNLPANTRLVVSCRTSRIADLKLPAEVRKFPLSGFTREETEAFVRQFGFGAAPTWIDDFQILSNGIPRVERYAMESALRNRQDPLLSLQPLGKTLQGIFEEMFQEALKKAGLSYDFERFCAALIALPRPIPVDYCARVSGIQPGSVFDICSDMAPGIRIEDQSIAFADEDIEEFVRVRGQALLDEAYQKAAELLESGRHTSDYAATHVATILFRAQRGKELLELIETEGEPGIIRDPLLRREVRLQRVKLGVGLAAERNDIPSALRAALRGAEAVKSDDAIADLLESNLDLSAAFAEESVTRRLLLNGDKVAKHGPLVAQLMLQAALSNQPTQARAYRRQFSAWLQRRDTVAGEEKDRGYQRRLWDISIRDIAALTEAEMLVSGPQDGFRSLLRWRPRTLALPVAQLVIPRLLTRGRNDLVQSLLQSDLIGGMSCAWLAVPLLRAGIQVPPDILERTFEPAKLRHFFPIRRSSFDSSGNSEFALFDTLLTGYELAAGTHRGDGALRDCLIHLSSRFLRHSERLWDHDTELLNILLRAYCLLAEFEDREASVDDFLGPAPAAKPDESDSDKRRKESLRTTISLLIPFFVARARAMVSGTGTGLLLGEVGNAARSVRNAEHRLSVLSRAGLYQLLMLNTFDLAAIPGADPSQVLDTAFSVPNEDSSSTGWQYLTFVGRAGICQQTHGKLLEWATQKDAAIAALRTNASEKIGAHLALSRVVMAISPEDASVFFRHAHEDTESVDADARFQLRTLGELVRKAKDVLKDEEKLRAACEFAALATSMALRIGDQEAFPWNWVAASLARLSAGVALAAVARWEDAAMAERGDTLEAVLPHLSIPGVNQVAMLVGMNPLLQSDSLLEEAAKLTASRGNGSSSPEVEDLSRDALILNDGLRPTSIMKSLEGLREGGVWLQALRSTGTFLAESGATHQVSPAEEESPENAQIRFTLPAKRYILPDEILEAVRAARTSDRYIPVSNVLKAIREKVATADRIAYLEALKSLPVEEVDGEVIVDALEDARERWNTAAVSVWLDQAVPMLLSTRLADFCSMLVYLETTSLVDRLLKLVSDPGTCSRPMLRGLGESLDALAAGMIYEVCRRVVQCLPEEDARGILLANLGRLVSALPDLAEVRFDASDVPPHPTAAMARFLFVLLSDVDVRVRWRSAHCLRRLVRYGADDLIRSMGELWERTTENSFRVPGAPFYWQAARLWLVATLSRIASEQPGAILPVKNLLLRTLDDSTYPHPALRSFAKDALETLESSGAVRFNEQERTLIESTNRSILPREKEDSEFLLEDSQHAPEGRLKFDPMDSIPYWYQPATRIFAHVSTTRLKAEAERWILDRWGAGTEFTDWRTEPRRNRFPENSWRLSSNDHGSMPTLERYRTFLEWYALQCAIGSLMKNEPLKSHGNGGEDELAMRLRWQRFPEAPYWLSDLLCPIPLERRLWFNPEITDEWVANIADADFVQEIVRGREGTELVAEGSARVSSSEFSLDVDVTSALVEPEHALALVRALQTAEEPMDYKLPNAHEDDSDRFAIDEPGFQLDGWVAATQSEGGFGEYDPLNLGAETTHSGPPNSSSSRPSLHGGVLSWPEHDGVFFRYERWKSHRDRSSSSYEGPELRTSGYRLYAKSGEVLELLKRSGRDLIFEVRITRMQGGSRHQIRTEEESLRLEGRFCGIILLRADGTLHTAEGCIGAWPLSGG